jgi:hypothetical protein
VSGVAAVDQVVAAGDERGGVAQQEQCERGDLLVGTEPTRGVLTLERGERLGGQAGADQRGVDEAGTDGVGAHAVRGVLQRGDLGQADQGVLAGDVGGVLRDADRTEH